MKPAEEVLAGPERRLLVDARAFCRFAGRTVTLAYRAGHSDARAIDAAHARIAERTRLRGTIPADTEEVRAIIVVSLDLERPLREPPPVEPVSAPRYEPEATAAAVERLDRRPALGAVRRRIGKTS